MYCPINIQFIMNIKSLFNRYLNNNYFLVVYIFNHRHPHFNFKNHICFTSYNFEFLLKSYFHYCYD